MRRAPCTVHGPIPGIAVSSAMSSSSGSPLKMSRVPQAVRKPLGEVAERADLPPPEPGLPELAGIDFQQLGGRGKVAAEKCLDTGQDPACRRDGKLLAGDLEQQGTRPDPSAVAEPSTPGGQRRAGYR